MQNNLSKVLDYKNQDYEILGELNENEQSNLSKKYYISPFFKFKRLVKKIIFICINFFLKQKIPLLKSRSLKNVEKKYDQIAGEYIERYLSQEDNNFPCDFGFGKKIFKVKGYPKKFSSSFLLNILEVTESNSFMEIGAGELTNIFEILKKNKKINFENVLALDISLPRLIVGNNLLKKNLIYIDHCINSNAENIPLGDNSIDLLFTVHCLEQVPHIAKNIIREMIRVANNYVVLIEPSYELGSEVTRNRIFKKDYIKLNKDIFKGLDAEIIYREKNRLSSYISTSEIVILKKKKRKNTPKKFKLVCPTCKKELNLINKNLVCNEENKIYRKKDGVFIFS